MAGNFLEGLASGIWWQVSTQGIISEPNSARRRKDVPSSLHRSTEILGKYVKIVSKLCELVSHEAISHFEHCVRNRIACNIFKRSWNYVGGNKSVSKLLPCRFRLIAKFGQGL